MLPLLSVSQICSLILAMGQICFFPQEAFFPRTQLFFCSFCILTSPSTVEFAAKDMPVSIRRVLTGHTQFEGSCNYCLDSITCVSCGGTLCLTYTWSRDMWGDSELNLLRHV